MSVTKLLVGSPIRQKPPILREFLLSLDELERDNLEVDFMFVDDNLDEQSSRMLADFAQSNGRTVIIKQQVTSNEDYDRNEHTHYWKESQVWKVAAMKDAMIAHATARGYDGLFLIDSDLVLHPFTLKQLVQANRPIVSCIFWTQWEPDTMEMPQVWVRDEYRQYESERRVKLDREEEMRRMKRFFARLRMPGLYEVGGLGACTLIGAEALRAGVNFKEIKNISFWGEDRHFCIRAQALGFDLFVDTTYPAYHIYRESDLAEADDYRRRVNEQREADSQRGGSTREMSPGQMYDYALAMHRYGYQETAAEYYERFLKSGQGSQKQRLNACWTLADIYAASNDRKQEKRLLQTYLKDLPYAELYCRMGFIYLEEEHWQTAALWYELALEAERTFELADSPAPTAWSWLPHLQLCVCYDRLQQYEMAYRHNELGAMLDSSHPGFAINRDYLKRRLAGLL